MRFSGGHGPATARSRGPFDPAAVRSLLERGEAPQIWALMQLELWARAFLDVPGRDRVVTV